MSSNWTIDQNSEGKGLTTKYMFGIGLNWCKIDCLTHDQYVFGFQN